MKVITTVAALLALLAGGWSTTPSWAWVVSAHQQITRDAITVLPEPLREVFEAHRERILYGVVQPDYDPQKVGEMHMLFLVPYRGQPSRPGGAAWMLEQFAKKAKELLKSGAPLDEVLFTLGQATHFVQDLNQPLHEVWWQTAQEHGAIEGQMFYYSWQKDREYQGFHFVKKYGCFAFEIAQRASQHSMALINGSDKDIQQITEISWDTAVNDTANFWQSVFVHALGAERARLLYEIAVPVKEIGKGWLC